MLRRNDENAYTFAYVYTKSVLIFNLKPKENGQIPGCQNAVFFFHYFKKKKKTAFLKIMQTLPEKD